MKKVTKIGLKEKLSGGKILESIEQPKPKKAPRQPLREVIAEGIEKSSAESQKAIGAMADNISAFIKAQSKAEPGEQVIKVEIPEPKKEKKKSWRFEVQRDRNGFIEKVIAEEI